MELSRKQDLDIYTPLPLDICRRYGIIESRLKEVNMVQESVKKRKRLAPYAPASALSAFFDHIRYVKTPDKIDSNMLQDYGIAKGQTFALLSTLKFLGLTEDDGTPTPAFKLLQTAGEEFQSNLREILQRAYSDLFSRLDVSRDSRDKILNFFARNYSPATAVKATSLFLDLCGEAGIPTAAKEPRRVARRAKESGIKQKEQTEPTQEEGKASNSVLRETQEQNRPQFDIRIDSKDFASMQPDQIQAFFNGLSKVVGQKESQEDQNKAKQPAQQG